MIIDRRELIVGAAVVAVAPTLKLLPDLLTSDETEPSPVTFMIEGWSSQDDGGMANIVWMRIGHAWRTTWR
jgi:hypothetical protein